MKALCAILCLLVLVGCAELPPAPPVDGVPLANRLQGVWPGTVPKVDLSDTRYELIPFNLVIRAALDARRQYVPDTWDCDDDVTAALYALRVRQQRDPRLPYAAGRLRGRITPGTVHDFVWALDSDTGKIRLWDVTYGFEPSPSSVLPFLLTDY